MGKTPLCPQCKQPNYGWFLNPVCGKCCRENHRAVVTGKGKPWLKQTQKKGGK